MNLNDNSSKLKLNYPCQWVYKVIGKNQESLKKAVSEIIKEKPYTINLSNNSRNNNYFSFNLELTVESEEERNEIYMSLKDNSSVIMVL